MAYIFNASTIWGEFYFGYRYTSDTDRWYVFGIPYPAYMGPQTGYTTITNAATGNGPSINFTSSAATKRMVIMDAYAKDRGNLINISGVDYARPSTDNYYLRSNGDGTTYWGA